ncbi:MAG: AAA family ATPase [Cyanobacteria bacterium P01_F01_bin.150]
MAEVQAGDFSNDGCLTENRQTLGELCRLLRLSQGEFELILAVCNSSQQRQDLLQHFQQDCPIIVQTITLEPSTTTLFTTLQRQVQLPALDALMIFGLDTVQDLAPVLTATNQIREEFRHLPFPIILWLTDDTLKQLIRLAPDFYTWANTFTFHSPTQVFTTFLDELIDDVWQQVKQARENDFLDNETLQLTPGSPRRQELETSLPILEQRGVTLAKEQLASLAFLQGRISNNNTPVARHHYQESLTHWQELIESQPHDSKHWELWQERRGYVQFYLGLWWLTRATRYQREMELAYEESHRYFQKAVDTFDSIQREDRVAHIISFLAELVYLRKRWPDLEKVASRASELQAKFNNSIRQARAEGFLAEVDLINNHFDLAHRRAERAMRLIESLDESNQTTAQNLSPRDIDYYDWVNSFHRSWYLFALGKSQLGKKQLNKAIQTLQRALSVTKPEYDPELYRQVLASLRQGYWEQGEYLKAFDTRRKKEAIESRFNLRAFIGAGRLQPKQQVKNSALPSHEVQQDLIAASGRELDVQHLLTRLRQDEFTLTIIYGPSGVGKSSLIEAGLLPALSQQRFDNRRVLAIHLRLYSDWIGEFASQLAKAVAQLHPSSKDRPDVQMSEQDRASRHNTPETLLHQLREQTSQNRAVVLILDQFEEFFFESRQPKKRQVFYEFLRDCLRSPYIKVILSLREDYTHYLLECNRLADLDIIDNNILDKKWLHFIGNFTPKDATTVFKDLTQKTPFAPDADLIEHIVAELSEELGEVRPIELQLIGTQLQHYEITTLTKYQEKATRGWSPKEALIQQYLTNVVDECGPEVNQQLARLILYLLTDEQVARPLKTTKSLIKELKTVTNSQDISEENLSLSLDILTKSGLVVKIHELSENHYQLVHDYIATLVREQQEPRLKEIISSLEKERKQRQQAEEQAQAKEKELNQVLKGRFYAYFISATLAFLAGLALFFWFDARNDEIQALNAVSIDNRKPRSQLDALLASIKAGERVKKNSILSELRPRIKEITLEQIQISLNNIRDLNRLEGHDDSVLSVSFDPKGEMLISSSADKHIHMWKVNGDLIKEIPAHSKDIRMVNFSPNGDFFASASDDGYINVWSRDGRLIKAIKAHAGIATNVVFHPNSQSVISADGLDGEITHWSLDGYLLNKFLGYKDENIDDTDIQKNKKFISSLDISPNGKLIVTGNGNNEINIWESDGTLVKTLTDHKDKVWDVQFSPDGELIASASFDKTVKIWGKDDQGWQLVNTLNAHGNRVLGVSFSPDGQTIASGSLDETIKLWNLKGQVLETLRGHDTGVRDITFHSEGSILASAGLDKTIRFWHQDTWDIVLEGHNAELRSIRFSPDGQTIVTSSNDKTIRLWNSDGTLISSRLFEDRMVNVHINSDGNTIVGASADGSIKLWNIESNEIQSLKSDSESISDVKFHPWRNIFVSVGQKEIVEKKGIVEIWSDSGSSQRTIDDAHQAPIYSMDFSPEGNLFVSGATDGEIKFWDMNGTVLQTIQSEQDIDMLAFSPDGQYLASAGFIGNTPLVKLWKLNREFNGTDLTKVSPLNRRNLGDFRTPALPSFGGGLKSVTLKGELVTQLKGHANRVISVAFNVENAETPLLASGDIGGKIILWSYEGKQLQTLQDLGGVWGLSFSPDGKFLASASDHRQGKLWKLDHQKLQALLPGDLNALLINSCNWLEDYIQTSARFENERPEPCQSIQKTQ